VCESPHTNAKVRKMHTRTTTKCCAVYGVLQITKISVNEKLTENHPIQNIFNKISAILIMYKKLEMYLCGTIRSKRLQKICPKANFKIRIEPLYNIVIIIISQTDCVNLSTTH